MLKIMKFGATVLRSDKDVPAIADRIREEVAKGWSIVVVVTATQETTRRLRELAGQVSPNPYNHQRALDVLLTSGERMSIALLAMALKDRGVEASSLQGLQAGVETDAEYGRASILRVDPEVAKRELLAGAVPVIAGFQGGVPSSEEETSLGRGGADLIAVAMAVALKQTGMEVDVCEIYTDVDGVYTADPKVVQEARRNLVIDFAEMLEITGSGQHLLSERTVALAMRENIPIRVMAMDGQGGTLIQKGGSVERTVIESVAIENQALISLPRADVTYQPRHRLFGALAQVGIVVDNIAQTKPKERRIDLDWTVSTVQADKALQVAERMAPLLDADSPSLYHSGIAKLKVVGSGLNLQEGIVAPVFRALETAVPPIEMEGITTSDNVVTMLVNAQDGERAVRLVHAALAHLMPEH